MKNLVRKSSIYFIMLLLVMGLLTPTTSFAQEAEKDLLDEALKKMGLEMDDLGYQPKGYWTRYPVSSGIKYKASFFDDLFAEPLRTYDFTRTMGNAADIYLNPEYLDSKGDGLFKASYYLSISRRSTGMRDYTANLVPEVNGETPVVSAVQRIYDVTGQKMQYSVLGSYASWPNHKIDLENQLKNVDKKIQKSLAELILNSLDAWQWREVAFRNVPQEQQNKVFYIRDLGETTGDGHKFYPEVEDVMKEYDEESLHYAALKAVQATQNAQKAFEKLLEDPNIDFENINLNFLTPIGRIIIGGINSNSYEIDDALIVVDFGGDDLYRGSIGATSRPGLGVSIAIDMAGNDKYEQRGNEPTQGTGVLGVGILADMAGDDTYTATKMAQGAGQVGFGLLYDRKGNDQYKLGTSGQGVGFFGTGMAFDIEGNDYYYIIGDGQGFGSVGGTGVLVNYSGDDKYVAEPLSSVANRGDYHSENLINANNAQGVGFGRRGDISDGHSWGGGLGAIIDIKGDDHYESGNWSLGTGYWYGTGLVYEGEGNDVYNSVYFTQASGAHFAIGALVDEGGNDKHKLAETGGAGFGFGWDFTNALFINKGGDDEYDAKIISYGLADIRSNAYFFELGGNDKYTYNKGQLGFGASDFRPDYKTPNPVAPYNYYAKNVGLFIDSIGSDQYIEREGEELLESSSYSNNKSWMNPSKDSDKYGYGTYGYGIDANGGTIPVLYIFD